MTRHKNGRYFVRCRRESVIYNLGHFNTVDEAYNCLDKFKMLFDTDRPKAVAMAERRVRMDSTTGVKGIQKSGDGFKVMISIGNGKEKCLGRFKSLELAKNFQENYYNESRTNQG